MDVAIVGERYLATLFRVAGIHAVAAANEDAAVAEAKSIIEAGQCKILFITERVASRLRSLRESLVTERKPFPVFVVIPDFEGVLGERKKELTELINRSLGVKLETGG